MSKAVAISQLFDLVRSTPKTVPADVIQRVDEEIAVLNKCKGKIPREGLDSLSFISVVAADLQNGKYETAQLHCKKAEKGFDSHLKQHLKSREEPDDRGLLIQYRKGLAVNAIPKLQSTFFETKLKPLSVEKLGAVPDKNGVSSKFANKVVELAWWMRVHDPPVYMCPTTKDGFDPKMYTEYSLQDLLS